MSPEAAHGEVVDARSDVFAVGIVLWELLAGQRLYRSGAGRKGALDQAREANIPELVSRGYPDEEHLFGIVRKALSKAPEERYQTAQGMLGDLEGYIESQHLVASALRFGEWLVEHFGAEIVELRRERERAAKEHDESSGEQASRPAEPARSEQPTLPDLDAGGLSATRAVPSKPPPAPVAEIPAPAPRNRPSSTTILALVVIFVAVGVIVSLFFGR